MNYIVLHTVSGSAYAKRVARSLQWIKTHRKGNSIERVVTLPVTKISAVGNDFSPDNTTIYARAAHPDTPWMDKLVVMEKMGFRVVNSTSTLRLTADKLACSLHLQGKVEHPRTWKYSKSFTLKQIGNIRDDIDATINHPDYIIAKPVTSMEQGANVKKIYLNFWPDLIREEIDKIPGDEVILQEFVPYSALHRVIVIGGKALPYTFMDKPEWHEEGDWKVSCCLNRTTMKLNEYPREDLLDMAEKVQSCVGGEINFIDIFEVPMIDDATYFTVSEINTACNLRIHENLARAAGRADWNIHYRIASYLSKKETT